MSIIAIRTSLKDVIDIICQTIKGAHLKFFQWTDSGYHQGNKLLSNKQIASLLSCHSNREEAYCSIQDYDEDGDIVGCYLYFDIDNIDISEAYSNMIDINFELQLKFGKGALNYFSGSKGFHVISNVYIKHSRCHEIVKMIAKDLKVDKFIDMSVYKTKAWFRCVNTWNPKGAFKIQIGDRDGLKDILKKCMFKQPLDYSNFKRFYLNVKEYDSRLPAIRVSAGGNNCDFIDGFMPCMRKIWDLSEPPEGQRHKFLHIMARHCYRSGLSNSEAINLFDGHHFWSTVNSRDYEKVIRSVYSYGHDRIGCKSGQDGDLLREYCQNLCHLNDEFDVTSVFKKEYT